MDPNMWRQVQEVQKRAEALQKGLAAIEVDGVAGGDLVRVTVNGLGEVKKLHIDPSLMKPGEAHIVEDLVVAACNDAKSKMEDRRLENTKFIEDLLGTFGGIKKGPDL